jgi:hypothetical protein
VADDVLFFNGVDAATGGYLFPPTPLATLAAEVRQEQPAGRHVAGLARRHAAEEDHLGVMWGRDPDDLASVGWALVTAEGSNPAVLEALAPLRALRRKQAGDLYRELVVRPGEDDDAFLSRHGMGPGPVDPRRVPYYLLLVGDPEQIPFAFQYQLDVEYAVGRLDFDTAQEYAAYAGAAVAAEATRVPAPTKAGAPGAPADPAALATAGPARRRVHLFGTRNPGDAATALSASRLVAPLGAELAQLSPGLAITADIGPTAVRDRLAGLLSGPDAPPLLFTASHGLGNTGADRRETQGAVLCQEWPGPLRQAGRVGADQYLAGHDVPADRPVGPRVVFSFCCYGAGTPGATDFDGPGPAPGRSFVARLPQRLLGHPLGGSLAFVGHVDRAFSCSFLWHGVDPQITGIASTMLALLDGARIGGAMEYLNARYAAIATQLTGRLQALRRTGKVIDDRTLTALWTANHDARNYVVLGDPAVRAFTNG